MTAVYRTQLVIPQSRILTLRGLPFAAGDRVEIVIVRRELAVSERLYPLRGLPIRYERPFDSVAEEEWDALR